MKNCHFRVEASLRPAADATRFVPFTPRAARIPTLNRQYRGAAGIQHAAQRIFLRCMPGQTPVVSRR
jgi:hypothetical protein